MKTKILILLCFIFAGSILVKAQPIVVSEYKNQTTASDEWIELLVVQDNFDLRGYKIRDNASGFTDANWQKPYIFADNAIWNHLRAGTIIVLNSRGATAQDVNPADGFIQVGLQNSTYIIQDSATTTSIDLVASGDVIEILSPTNVHIHSLSHSVFPNTLYSSLPDPKANWDASIASGSTVGIFPGANIAGYSGHGSGFVINSTNPQDNTVQGFPNFVSAGDAQNSNYWRSLRQPAWNSPNLTATPISNGVQLNWNSAQDAYNADKYQGYLIVRCDSINLAGLTLPLDGKLYKKGDALGTGIVVDTIKGSNILTYSDYFTLACGRTYVYKVFAYRYDPDHLYKSNPTYITPWTARGRQYNEIDFATANAKKPAPAKPIINSGKDTIYVCSGNTIELAIAQQANCVYQWFYENSPIGVNGATYKYTTGTEGFYKITVTNTFGCEASDTVYLALAPIPNVQVYTNGNPIKKDTNVTICGTGTFAANASGAETIKWYNSGVETGTGAVLITSVSGLYYAVGTSKYGCIDTSVKITVNIKNENYLIDKKLDTFKLACQNIAYDSIKIENLVASLSLIEIQHKNSDYSIPSSFNLIGNSDNYIPISFSPNKSGISNDTIIIKGECGKLDTIFVYGVKDANIYQTNLNKIEFNDLALCETELDTFFVIRNTGSQQIHLGIPAIASPFSVVSSIPKSISAGDTFSIQIKFKPNIEGVYNTELKLAFTSGACNDTIRIPISGKAYQPNLNLDADSLLFSDMIGCSQLDSMTVKVTNPNPKKVNISANCTNGNNPFYCSPSNFALESDSSAFIKVFFKPNNNGSFSESLNLSFDICNTTKTIKILGKKDGLSISFNPADSIIFGNIPKCQAITALKNVSFVYNGKASDSIVVENILLPIGITANIKNGDTLNNGEIIQFAISDNFEGIIDDFAIIELSACDYVYKTKIKANIYSKYYSHNDTLDFGAVEINKNKTLSLVIQNLSYENVNFINSNISTNHFELTTALPINITTNTSKQLDIKFAPSIEGDFIAELRLFADLPCPDTSVIYLKGSAYYSLFKYSAYLPETTKIIPGRNSEIPIKISVNPIDGAKLIDSIELNIKYNPTIIAPSFSSTPEFNLISNVMGFNDIKIVLQPKDKGSLILNSTKIGSIVGKSYLGDSILSSIYFSQIKIYSDGIFEQDTILNGELEIANICAPGYRIINLNKGIEGITNKSNTADFCLEIKSSAETTADIKIYNILGELLLDQKQISVNKGITYFVKPKYELPCGVLFIQINNNSFIYRDKFIIE